MEKTMLDYALEEAKELLKVYHKAYVSPRWNDNEFVIHAYARNGRRMETIIVNEKTIDKCREHVKNVLANKLLHI